MVKIHLMDYDQEVQGLSGAIADFRRARNQANLKELLARLTGESNQLLSYDEVRQKMGLQGGTDRGVRDIPLDAIVGSVGRYTDFTRDFLPRQEVRPERWARVHVAASGSVGLPPIDVYQIGDVYFVKDGNHRVSVARQLGAKYIQAYVTEVQSRVPLTTDVKPDELILKGEYNRFLEATRLDQLRPDADLSVTIPGQYDLLLEHIEVHRYFMGIDFNRPISYAEAVTHWYDAVYLPIVRNIRNQGILRNFPGRTEADLYLWIAEHRSHLEEELGFPIRAEYAVGHIQEENRTGWVSRLASIILPDEFEDGPPVGQWRENLETRAEDRLFLELLVPLNGKEDGWCALEQSFMVAGHEHSLLHGLHVTISENDPELEAIREEFNRRCSEKGAAGNLIVTGGEVVEQTCLRATATDLVVVNLSYPPAPQPLARLGSGFRTLLLRCPRPVLATPQTVSHLSHALLAFDGSVKAREALYIAAYLSEKWGIPLEVVSVEDSSRTTQETLSQAKTYLENHNVQARYFLESGHPAEAILRVHQREGCDWIVMGGYGLNPLLEFVLGSTVDQVLRESNVPTLICR